MAFIPPELSPGDELTADWLNDLLRLVASSGLSLDASSGVEGYRGARGTQARLRGQPGLWVRIAGAPTGGGYPWVEQVPDDGGAWVDGPRSGTATADPAYESGGSTTVPAGARAWAHRDPAVGSLRFTYAACP